MTPIPLLAPWAPGPAATTTDDVVISVTDFAVTRWRDVPRIAMSGLRLRMGWYAMEGAVGLWLWSLPLERRSGSISVWTAEEALRRFVALPAHIAIMRRHRHDGTLRSTDWCSERFLVHDVVQAARRWILASEQTTR
jgi:hypothetical protein